MNSIDTYIDAARENARLVSDNQLARALEMSSPQVSNWRKRKTMPSDEAMVKLASIAGENIDLALLYLNWWRALSRNEMAAADHYKHMIEAFYSAAA